jgi:arginyl-tRNA synthetase
MKTIQTDLISLLKAVALEAFPQIGEEISIDLTQSTQKKFGHYQFNSCLKWSKLLNLPPRKIAEEIVSLLTKKAPFEIKGVEIAGAGFINITLNPSYLEAFLEKEPSYPKTNKKVIIDFSSPNTAKEMHVGHLRSTVIGDALSRLFEFLGDTTVRLNHIGDFGTSFGMLIAYMKEVCPQIINGDEETDLTHLVQWYKASKILFDSDPLFKKRAQLEVVSLQGGDPESVKAWEKICAISRKAYQEIYDLLEVKLTERGESFYKPYLKKTVESLEEKGLIRVSEGAKCVFIEGFETKEGGCLPLIVEKSDGGYTYATTDLAAIWHRTQIEKGDALIYVIDQGQSTHIQMVFKAAQMAGFLPQKVEAHHVGFGLVLGTDGKKFKTRSGDTERLIDLLERGVEEALSLIEEKNPNLPLEEKKELAKSLGIGAIKYADLSCSRTQDYTFSYERMLKFEGNTAAFLIYAYVRISGIKRKLNKEVVKKVVLIHDQEIALGLKLAQFHEALMQMRSELAPNRLCDYLFTLAETFNGFYRDCQVEGDENEGSRLFLCEKTAYTLKTGLNLLGINTVERM